MLMCSKSTTPLFKRHFNPNLNPIPEMSTSSSSISCPNKNPKFFKVDLDGNVYCNHDMLANQQLMLTVKTSNLAGTRVVRVPSNPLYQITIII